MELRCLCLNVCLNVQQSSYGRTVDLEPLRQENEEDPFEGCCLKEMDIDISGIIMEQKSIVHETLCGDLRVFKCYGCDMVTHCVHQHKPGRLFVNFALVKDQDKVAELRQSARYSDVFRVVLSPNNESGFNDVMSLQRNLRSPVVQAQQTMESYVMAEEAAVEARIQSFIEEQHMGLTRVKQRSQQELQTLYTVMSRIPPSIDRQPKTEGLPTQYSSSADRPENMSVLYSSNHSTHRPDDFSGCDGIFSMDDFEAGPRKEKSAFLSDDDDDDTSTDNSFQGSQVGLAMPPSIVASASEVSSAWVLGKSAPVHMPGRQRAPVDGETPGEGLTPSFEDIGNSMKALARSVQDQTTLMFGELPRPRTATSFINTDTC